MNILGISCYYHDAAACVVRDGEVVAAVEEERLSRRKHDAGFPSRAIPSCLEIAGVVPAELDHVIFHEKPLLKFERIVSGYAASFPRSREVFARAMETWLAEKLWVRSRVKREVGHDGPVLFGEHHLSHAASAYYPSPFDHAAIVTADGVGEWATATVGWGCGLEVTLTDEIRYPHSIGLMFSAFTAYLGFEVNDGEYKVMGMAAYGRPTRVDEVRRILRVADDGSFVCDMDAFEYHRSLRSFGRAFVERFGPPRAPGSPLDQRHADIAASVQVATEEAMVALARRARDLSGSENVCLAGGVALNVLANSRILREAGFRRIWVQPAAGDSGGSVGAALHLYHGVLRGEPRRPMRTALLGPAFSDDEIHAFLRRERIPYRTIPRADLPRTVAALLARGDVVGWVQGRMEFGPRALGARSVIASPLDDAMRDRVNERIKHREEFRPFAPSVVAEEAGAYFTFGVDGTTSPFMLLAAATRPERRHQVPAVTHVDGTARVQTVEREEHPLFHDLIAEFGALTGVPVLLNTSFNVRGEPIVCTPADAFNTFSHTDLDHLVIGDAIVDAGAKRPLGPYPGSERRSVATPEACMAAGAVRFLALAPPLVFLLLFALAAWAFLLPAAATGHALAIVLTAIAAVVFGSHTLATLTVALDLARGRLP